MSSWQLNIEKVTNGYICTHLEEQEENSFVEQKYLIEEEASDEYGEAKAMCGVLCYVMDHFGMHNDKYKKYRLRPTFIDEKGKVVDEEDMKY